MAATVFIATALVVLVFILWVYGAMLEQVDTLAPSGIKKRVAALLMQALSASFLVIALLFTNCYKGMIRSNYIEVNDYVTDWNRLEQMENFSLYFVFEPLDDGSIDDQSNRVSEPLSTRPVCAERHTEVCPMT